MASSPGGRCSLASASSPPRRSYQWYLSAEMYVDANFKEVQLKMVRPGQKVELVSDLYGHKVAFHGVVEGFNGGTGAAFALIPAQNATGNWIKVVQRLPVRIRLNPDELAAHPLRVGLSMDAKVDLRSSSEQSRRPPRRWSTHKRSLQQLLKGPVMSNLSMNSSTRPLEGGMLWVGGIVLALANFVAVLNMTIANVTVPNIAAHSAPARARAPG